MLDRAMRGQASIRHLRVGHASPLAGPGPGQWPLVRARAKAYFPTRPPGSREPELFSNGAIHIDAVRSPNLGLGFTLGGRPQGGKRPVGQLVRFLAWSWRSSGCLTALYAVKQHLDAHAAFSGGKSDR